MAADGFPPETSYLHGAEDELDGVKSALRPAHIAAKPVWMELAAGVLEFRPAFGHLRPMFPRLQVARVAPPAVIERAGLAWESG